MCWRNHRDGNVEEQSEDECDDVGSVDLAEFHFVIDHQPDEDRENRKSRQDSADRTQL